MSLDEDWRSGEWGELNAVIRSKIENYNEDFCGWLEKRPGLWYKFIDYGRKAVEKHDPYGFSALALLHILEWDFIDKDDRLGVDDYRHAGDLGRLLIEMYPETHESLWRGERYQHPMCSYLDSYIEMFEQENEDLKGFLVSDDESLWSDPECMVFPELANLPAAEPVDYAGHA